MWWLENARRVSDVEIDVVLRIEPALYVGPRNGFTPEEWRTLREPIGVPLSGVVNGWISATRALAQIDVVAEHYRRTLAIAARRGLAESAREPAFWMRPRIGAEADVVARFAWNDTYLTAIGVLEAIAKDARGVLHSDLDQGWEIAIVRDGDDLRIGEADEIVAVGGAENARTIVVARARAVEAANAARERIDRLVDALVAAIGADPWQVGSARRARSRS